MAEKSTILPKKLISLNKTFNTSKAKEQKQAKATRSELGTSSFDSSSSATESTECLANRKTSLFSGSNGKADNKLRCFASKSVDIGRPSDSRGDLDARTKADKKSKDARKSKSKSTDSEESDKSQLISRLSSSLNKTSKSVSKASAFSFFTSTNASTPTKPSVRSTSANASTEVKPTTALSTIHSTTSSLSGSPKSPSTPAKGSLKGKSKAAATNQSLPKFKLTSGKKKPIEQQWHADSQMATSTKASTGLNNKTKLKEKSSKSSSLRSRTARTINTFVKPIKRPSIRFENKKLTFSGKPRIEIEQVTSDPVDVFGPQSPDDSRSVPSTSPGLKVSFDEELKIDRHRSNSDNSSRLGKKQNLISSLRRSIFANPELSASSCTSDRSLSIPNKSLSNRMLGMISKGKSHLAIVRSHSLESNKFSAKRVSLRVRTH